MIRQDQITQAALDYFRQYKTSKLTAENAALLAFSDGAQWADENPKTSTLAEACRKKENEAHRYRMELEDHYSLWLYRADQQEVDAEPVAISNNLTEVQEIYDAMLCEIEPGDTLSIIRRRKLQQH